MALLTPESILRQIISLYEDNYATSLATVESNWEDTEDIELTDFLTRTITSDPNALERQWHLPAMTATYGPIREAAITSQLQQYHSFFDMQTLLTYYLSNPDATILGKIVSRHIEATLDMFKRFPGLGMQSGKDRVVPGTMRFSPSLSALRGAALVKGLLIQFDFRFMSYGT